MVRIAGRGNVAFGVHGRFYRWRLPYQDLFRSGRDAVCRHVHTSTRRSDGRHGARTAARTPQWRYAGYEALCVCRGGGAPHDAALRHGFAAARNCNAIAAGACQRALCGTHSVFAPRYRPASSGLAGESRTRTFRIFANLIAARLRVRAHVSMRHYPQEFLICHILLQDTA